MIIILINFVIFYRIRAFAVCKKDCDYNSLLDSCYTTDVTSFIYNVASSLSPNASATCQQTLSKYYNSTQPNATNSSSLLCNIYFCAIFLWNINYSCL